MPRRTRRRKKPSTIPDERRRELREKTTQQVVVRGLAAPGERFDHPTRAKDASLRGMALLLPMPLPLETPVLAENPATGVRTLYRVVYVEALGEGTYRIGLEAPDPHPRFWSKPAKKK